MLRSFTPGGFHAMPTNQPARRRTNRNAVARTIRSRDVLGMSTRAAFEEADAILAAIADNDRRTRTLRIQQALEAKRTAEAGNWYAGTRPYGWRSVGHGRLEPVRAEQLVIDWMLRQREAGYGWDSITRRLGEAGTPAPQGDRWHMSTVRRIVNRGRDWTPPGAMVDVTNEAFAAWRDSRSGGETPGRP